MDVPACHELLELGEGRPHRRTDGGTGGEDEVHRHHLVFHQVGIEADRLAVLVDQRDVGNLESVDLLGLLSSLSRRRSGGDGGDDQKTTGEKGENEEVHRPHSIQR